MPRFPMTAARTRRRTASPVLVLSLLAVWIVAIPTGSAHGASAASGPPGVPGLPIPIPPSAGPKAFPGAKVVTFKMVFEGDVRAVGTRTFNGAVVSFCKANGKDTIYENTQFQRGKGVLMEFVRYKQHGQIRYAVQRVGRNGDSSFAVSYKLKRRALGTSTWTPAFPPAPCLGVQNEDFSQGFDCGKTFSGTSNWGLRLKGSTFSIAPLRGSSQQISNCGKSSYFGGLEKLDWQWPHPYPFDFVDLPLAKMFGHTSAFKEVLIEPNPHGSTTSGQVTFYEEGGPGSVTVRFIRVPNAP